jgi:hypothetical protein
MRTQSYVYVIKSQRDNYNGPTRSQVDSVWRTLTLARAELRKLMYNIKNDLLRLYPDIASDEVETRLDLNEASVYLPDDYYAEIRIYRKRVLLTKGARDED